MAIIDVNYEGGNYYDDEGNLIKSLINYKGVTLSIAGEEYEFNSGDFVKDWAFAKKKFASLKSEPHFSHSSSVNHFIMDGAQYDSAYAHIINAEVVLKYVDTSDPNYLSTQREIYEDGWEFFVPKGSKFTWEDLKKYCYDE